jgi:cyclic dehypoxanthinyl futalosine synthase
MTQRITFEEGVRLFKEAPLEELQKQANAIRFNKNPKKEVTFILDSNPNYTNVCNADCTFCAFYRKKRAVDSYTKNVEQVMEHFELARQAGLTQVLLQGGLNDDLPLSYYVDLIRTAVRRYPDVHLHGFSAPEIWNIARIENISIHAVLQSLFDAGLTTIPGGGAEILSEKVRKRISPKKMGPGVWIAVHRAAHQIGFKTTATMMYGHVEEPEDIVEHLDILREAQDEIPGFTAFIPWSYKRESTALRRVVSHWAGADAYFKVLAFSRIYLDNFDHVQASWFSEGKEIGMDALHYGADDFGGIIFEESVHRAAKHINKADHNDVLRMIRQSGFEPVQRNVYYDTVRRYDNEDEVYVPEIQKVKEEDSVACLEPTPV